MFFSFLSIASGAGFLISFDDCLTTVLLIGAGKTSLYLSLFGKFDNEAGIEMFVKRRNDEKTTLEHTFGSFTLAKLNNMQRRTVKEISPERTQRAMVASAAFVVTAGQGQSRVMVVRFVKAKPTVV